MAAAAVAETMKGSDRNVEEEHQGYIDYRSFCEQWVDKMDFVVSDAPCTFEADPSRSAFRFAFSYYRNFSYSNIYFICPLGLPYPKKKQSRPWDRS